MRIAREVAQEGDALVAGNICNTWAYDPDDPSTREAVRAMYAEQLGWAAEEGIDFVISETNDYLGEALIALEVIHGLGLPAMVTLAPTQPDQTRDGYSYAEACRILAAEGAQIVGLNCDRGPQTDAAADSQDPGNGGLRSGRPAGALPNKCGRPNDAEPPVPRHAAVLPSRA